MDVFTIYASGGQVVKDQGCNHQQLLDIFSFQLFLPCISSFTFSFISFTASSPHPIRAEQVVARTFKPGAQTLRSRLFHSKTLIASLYSMQSSLVKQKNQPIPPFKMIDKMHLSSLFQITLALHNGPAVN